MINRYDLSAVFRSRALFTVATSYKLWIAKLAHKRVFFIQYFKRNFDQEKYWYSGRKYNCYPKSLSE